MKKILIITIAAIFGFGISFTAVWFAKSKEPAAAEEVKKTADATTDVAVNVEASGPKEIKPLPVISKSLPEKRLQNLIEDVRNKISDYKNRERELDEYKQQLDMTRETLSKEIQQLTDVYEQLSKQVLSLKKQQKMLEDKVVEIRKDQSQRLQQLASVYNKMDETASSKIFVNMMSNNQINDAAKIIFFMSDKKAASVLGEITNREPALARALCTKIKYLKEEI